MGSARGNCVIYKGMSAHRDINAMLALFWGSASVHQTHHWFDRLPSESNPADALTKPNLDRAHLQGSRDDTGSVNWDHGFNKINIFLGRQSLPKWPEIVELASLRASSFQ